MQLFKVIKSVALLILCTVVLSGCVLSMRDQPKHEPLEQSEFFDDNRSSRPLLENTVSRGNLRIDRHLYTGTNEDGSFVTDFPFEVTSDVLDRGQNRYDVFCAPCHGATGNGLGMIVQRGMPQPASLHDQRLRDAEAGYYYSVMTNGFGRMYSYASRISPEDRWAIVAYVRALQLSQNASLADISAEGRELLEASEALEE